MSGASSAQLLPAARFGIPTRPSCRHQHSLIAGSTAARSCTGVHTRPYEEKLQGRRLTDGANCGLCPVYIARSGRAAGLRQHHDDVMWTHRGLLACIMATGVSLLAHSSEGWGMSSPSRFPRWYLLHSAVIALPRPQDIEKAYISICMAVQQLASRSTRTLGLTGWPLRPRLPQGYCRQGAASRHTSHEVKL